MALLDFLKGKKNKEKVKEAAPAPVEPVVEEPVKQPSLMDITGSQIEQHMAAIIKDDRSVFEVIDEMANRLISSGREPHISAGLRLQDRRSEITNADIPYFDFDTALIAAVEQVEHYCDYGSEQTLEKALSRLDSIFEARRSPTTNTKRDVLRLKGHYLNAQLLALQGQLFSSNASITEYRNLLSQFEANKTLDPLGQRAIYVKQQLEHSEKMQQVLTDNIGTLKLTITNTRVEMETAPVISIDPKSALQSTIELINKQREEYKAYLRQISDFQQLLELINAGATEITVLERATEQQVRESLQRIEAEQRMRQKREGLSAYGTEQKVSPAAAQNEAQPNVDMAEEVASEPAPQMIDFL